MNRHILERVEKLRAVMKEYGADAFVVINDEDSNWESLFYISGFRGTAGAAIIYMDSAELILDPRYYEQGRKQSPYSEILKQTSSLPYEVKVSLIYHSAKNIRCEADRTSHYTWLEMSCAAGIWKDGSDWIKRLRRTKDADETADIRKSARIASDAFLNSLDSVRPGMTEKEFESLLNYKIGLAGGEAGFNMIVASGVRSSMPHGRASEKEMKRGEWVTVDYGARWNGYFCDITRNFSIGEPDGIAVELHEMLLRAHRDAASMLKPGADGSAVHGKAVEVLNSKDMGKYFTHSLGHGFGLEIHEEPLLSGRKDFVLAEGDIVTIEPGVYIEGKGGMRLEDDYLITANGSERLTDMLDQRLFTVII